MKTEFATIKLPCAEDKTPANTDYLKIFLRTFKYLFWRMFSKKNN